MKSLRDLNSFASLTVEFTDERDATVTFDRPVPTNQTITTTENNTYSLPVGTEIETIVDYTTTDPYVEFDFTAFAGSVDLVFPTLPAHLTVTESPSNFFTVSGLQTPADWNLIKSPTVQPPFGFTGIETITVNIRWTTADGSTTDVETYTVTNTIVDQIYISDAIQINFYRLTNGVAITAPTIVADLGITNPTWTLVIVPSVPAAVSTISTTGDAGTTTSFNATTKAYTIIGDKTGVNSHLANLQMSFTGDNQDFLLNYNLSNNLNAIVEIEVQVFKNTELAGAINAAASVNANGTRIKFFAATANSSSSMVADGIRIQQPWINVPPTQNYAALSTVSMPAPSIKATEINPTWTITITPNDSYPIQTITSSGVGGTTNFNSTTKVFTITGNRTQVNSHLSTLSLTTTGYQFDFEFQFRADENVQGQTYYAYVDYLATDETILQITRSDDTYTQNGVAAISGGPLPGSSLSASAEYEYTITAIPNTFVSLLESNELFFNQLDNIDLNSSTFNRNIHVTKDGNRLFNLNTNNNTLYIYERSGNTWSQVFSMSATFSPFGSSKTVYSDRTGDTFAISSSIYTYNGTTWTLYGTFNAGTYDVSQDLGGPSQVYNLSNYVGFGSVNGNGDYFTAGGGFTIPSMSNPTGFNVDYYFTYVLKKDGNGGFTIITSDVGYHINNTGETVQYTTPVNIDYAGNYYVLLDIVFGFTPSRTIISNDLKIYKKASGTTYNLEATIPNESIAEFSFDGNKLYITSFDYDVIKIYERSVGGSWNFATNITLPVGTTIADFNPVIDISDADDKIVVSVTPPPPAFDTFRYVTVIKKINGTWVVDVSKGGQWLPGGSSSPTIKADGSEVYQYHSSDNVRIYRLSESNFNSSTKITTINGTVANLTDHIDDLEITVGNTSSAIELWYTLNGITRKQRITRA